MICIHHNKDLDGFASGAVVKYKFPEATLIGWDYSDPRPDFEQFREQEVIMIDITFPIREIIRLSEICSLTIIDHHISFKKEIEDITVRERNKFQYIYETGKAACEIGWRYFMEDEPTPYAITLLGRYDTWRQKEGNWEEGTLPFQYGMRLKCTSVETFPVHLLNSDKNNRVVIESIIQTGRDVLKYQEQNDAIVAKTAVVKEAYGGLRALVVNQGAFSSNTLKTVYNPEEHDIMVGFFFKQDKWIVSLRADKAEVDCSAIAKARGGGGHKGAAGFEVKGFENILK